MSGFSRTNSVSVRLRTVVAHVVQLSPDDRSVALRLALENVEGWSGTYRSANRDTVLAGPVKKFRAGDVLFGRLRPYLAKVACPDTPGLCVSEFLVLRPHEDRLHPEFLSYWLRAKPVVDVISSATFGAKMPRTEWRFVGNLQLPLPPMSEQLRIVRDLKRATAKLDSALAATRREIELLKEYRARLIADVVTGRLDVREAADSLPGPNEEGA